MPHLIEPRRRGSGSGIDLTPLVDVVFRLLIFFLVTSQFTQPVASLELPPGKPGAKPEESDIRVELTIDGELRVNGESIAARHFEETLETAMAVSGTRRIRFHGDRRIDYGRFVDLLDRARLLGIDGFSIIKSEKAPDETGANE